MFSIFSLSKVTHPEQKDTYTNAHMDTHLFFCLKKKICSQGNRADGVEGQQAGRVVEEMSNTHFPLSHSLRGMKCSSFDVKFSYSVLQWIYTTYMCVWVFVCVYK